MTTKRQTRRIAHAQKRLDRAEAALRNEQAGVHIGRTKTVLATVLVASTAVLAVATMIGAAALAAAAEENAKTEGAPVES
jgi:hypothetical protein